MAEIDKYDYNRKYSGSRVLSVPPLFAFYNTQEGPVREQSSPCTHTGSLSYKKVLILPDYQFDRIHVYRACIQCVSLDCISDNIKYLLIAQSLENPFLPLKSKINWLIISIYWIIASNFLAIKQYGGLFAKSLGATFSVKSIPDFPPNIKVFSEMVPWSVFGYCQDIKTVS